MNKVTKNILYGIGTFVLCMVIITLIRFLIKGISIEDQLKDWWNWTVAAFGGISAGWSSYNKDKAKEEKAKKEKNNS